MSADRDRLLALTLLDLDSALLLLSAAPLVVKEPAPSAPLVEKARGLIARALDTLEAMRAGGR